jgi:PTS system mannose-specific IIB component
MRNIVLISHGQMARGVKESLEMIVGKQEHVHVVSMPNGGDNIQFEKDLSSLIDSTTEKVLIIADLLGGTPCNVALKLYNGNPNVELISGMNLATVLEASLNENAKIEELVKTGRSALVDAMHVLNGKINKETEEVNLGKFTKYEGKAKLVNVRIDERLIHGQVAGIWTTSLDTQRIIVANDEAAKDDLQKSSLRVAAAQAMRLSVLPVEKAAENINAGKYGKQRIFLLFKNPTDVLRFIKAGGILEKVNVGNMSFKDGAKEITKSIKVLPAEVEVFNKIATTGVKVTAQLVPSDPVIDFIEKLNKKFFLGEK